MTERRFLLVAIAVLFVWAAAATAKVNGASDAAQTAKDSVEALSDQLEGLRERETALADSAAKADSVVVAVRDSVADLVAETDTVLVAQMDTIEVLVKDTTALRIIAERDSVHAVRLASKDSIIAAHERRAALFPSQMAAKNQIIANLEVQLGKKDIVIADQDRQLRGRTVAKWGERGVLVAAALCGFGVICSG